MTKAERDLANLRARIRDIADQIAENPTDHGWTWPSLAADLREAARRHHSGRRRAGVNLDPLPRYPASERERDVPRWTPATRDLVSAAIASARSCKHAGGESCEPWWHADAALTALADAGLLVEPGGETRIERVAETVQPSGAVTRRPVAYEPDEDIAEFVAWMRRDQPYATGHRVLDRTVHTGPWKEQQP